MLNIPFGHTRFCDGISRRNFLKVGSLSFGALNLTLADVLRDPSADHVAATWIAGRLVHGDPRHAPPRRV